MPAVAVVADAAPTTAARGTVHCSQRPPLTAKVLDDAGACTPALVVAVKAAHTA